MTNQKKVQIVDYGQMTREVIESSIFSPSPCFKRNKRSPDHGLPKGGLKLTNSLGKQQLELSTCM